MLSLNLRSDAVALSPEEAEQITANGKIDLSPE